MFEAVIGFVALIITAGIVANFRQKKFEEEYRKYREELDKTPQASYAKVVEIANRPQIGSFKKNDSRVWLDI